MPVNKAMVEHGCISRRDGIASHLGGYYVGEVRTISLKLPEDLLLQLDNEAKARRITKSQVVRESLERGLRNPPSRGKASCYDLARDLAGSIKDLSPDLADNPKYVKDFGE